MKKLKEILEGEIPKDLAELIPSIVKTGKFRKQLRKVLDEDSRKVALDYMKEELRKYDLSKFLDKELIEKKLRREMEVALENQVKKVVQDFMLKEADTLSKMISKRLHELWDRLVKEW